MKPTNVGPTSYGSVHLHPGGRYRVILEFRDYDATLHEVGEEWVFRGYDVFPYDDGHTLFVDFSSGEHGVIRLQWHSEAQAHILEHFEKYVTPVQQAFPGEARKTRA